MADWHEIPCKIWDKSFNKIHGYGKAYHNGSVINAHRKVYLDHYGSIPSGFVIMHRCHNRACVEIKHLEAGTQQENMSDASALGVMGRNMEGDNNPNRKLDSQDVRNILDLHFEGEMSRKALGKMYGVTDTLIGQIIRGVRWATV